jgi:flagellar protein FliS
VSAPAARQRYLADKVNTATPAQLIVMLYDRLTVDIERAATAQSAGDLAAGSAPLLHAQQIVTELHSSLNVSVWAGGEQLASLYVYILLEIIGVHGTPDPERLRAVGQIVLDLRSAWSQAAEQLTSGVRLSEHEPVASGAWVG